MGSMSCSSGSNISKLFTSAVELLEPEESIIIGEVPEWVEGTLIRVGPGKWDFDNFTMNHYLDGYAILSKFEISGNVVKFTKKYLESDAYKKATQSQKPQITEFGTRAFVDNRDKGLFSRIISSLTPSLDLTDNATCSLFQMTPCPSAPLFVTSNTPFFTQIHPKSLSKIAKFDYFKNFSLHGVSVHPLIDSEGDCYNIGFSVVPSLRYNVIKLAKGLKYDTSEEMSENYTNICSIPSRWNTAVGFFHSFGLSTNYIIFIEIPYVISMTKAAKSILKGTAFKEWLEWREKEEARFYVINKKTGDIVNKGLSLVAESFFFLHIVNSYEENENIILDINLYKSPKVLDDLYIKNLRSNSSPLKIEKEPPCVHRFIIPLNLSKLSTYKNSENLLESQPNSEINCKFTSSHPLAIKQNNSQILLVPSQIAVEGMELPTINPNYLGRKYKYYYGAGTIYENYYLNSIGKCDVEKGENSLWSEEDIYPGEALFLPRDFKNSCENGEDDGVLVSACSNCNNGSNSKDFLLFLNAKNMEEIGRAYFKAHIPQAMHGIFLHSL